ncbi:hypothetical protein F2Q70_00022885 [Brassica cretica]|uniref:Pre-mRNA-processing protein 40C n=1 Tax=Brassica cretica TaxID=69181 RepID=A0A8S9GHR9_BRACR|nr:hypothetical protein F2Q70_00022885 [Brassica cretica]
MEGENVTELLNTAAPSTGEGIFATAPPPSDSVLATAASSVSPSSKSQPEQSSMSVVSFQSLNWFHDVSVLAVQIAVSQSVSSSLTAQSSANPIPQAPHMLQNPPFGRPGTLAPPGLMTSPPAFPGSNPFSTIPRPGGPAQINPGIHPHMYPPYHSMPPMHGTPQGMWLQPRPMDGIPRAHFPSHPTPFPGNYPFPVRGASSHLPYPGSQPLPVGNTGTVHALPGHQPLDVPPGQKPEALSGIDDRAGSQLVGNRVDAWTAHKSETGVVYYYNSVTGQSTYEKPPGFEREPDKVPVQPIPISMENIHGTDWALVSTNDGKKYYYNNKTKVSSWQIPPEVKDLVKKTEERSTETCTVAVFDAVFLFGSSFFVQAIQSHSVRRSLFEQYVKTRAEEERREKRAAHKAAVEGFKQLLDEASKDIDKHTDYHTFKKKWGNDLRFESLERKEREALLNERILSLKRAADQKAQEIRAAAASDFKTMLHEREVYINSHWSKVKDSLRNDPRYRSAAHEDREVFYNEYIAELKAARGDDYEMKSRGEEDKLRERERELRKRKEREVLEVERVRQKIRRKEAVASYQALLVEKIRDPEVFLRSVFTSPYAAC